MLNGTDFENILNDIKYRDWKILIKFESCRYYIQIQADEWNGRKWYLSPYMTRGEVVQTAFLAIAAAEEHERRKDFTYKGQPIFRPHYDLDALVELCQNQKTEFRKEKTDQQ